MVGPNAPCLAPRSAPPSGVPCSSWNMTVTGPPFCMDDSTRGAAGWGPIFDSDGLEMGSEVAKPWGLADDPIAGYVSCSLRG